MKILHLIYDHINNPWVGGGGAVRAFQINKRLSGKGHKITIISGKYPNAKDYKENDNLYFKFLGNGKNYFISVFSYAYESMKYLKKYAKEYDIVIEDFAPWNPVFSKSFHNKTILQLHHKEGINIFKRYFIFGFPFMLIENFYPKLYKNIITVSEISKNKFGVDAFILPNGIDENLIFKENKTGEYIAYIGRIDLYNKGLDLLIDAFSDINIPLYIAGKGKDEKKLLEMIDKKGLKNKIKFVGFLTEKEKIDFIKNSRFIIMPSRFEGQGIVALEAAALGKPMVVSDIPELNYVVKSGFGISFKSENINDLKEKLLFMWKNDYLIQEMTKKGKEFAKEYTWDKITENYEKYLLEKLK